MNITINSMYRSTALAALVAVLVVLPFAFTASQAYADDLGGFYDTYTPADTGGFYDTYTPSDTGGYYDTYTPSYSDYSGGLYGSGYGMSSYMGGYMTGGFFGGGYITGGSIPVGGGSNTYAPTTISNNGNTSIYAPTQTNTCTAGNSCNSSTNIVTNMTNPAPTVVYSNPTPVVYNYSNPTPVCNTCGCLGYPSCAPIVPAAPYVSLTQVPYTGLDLGFWGTIAYWSFLVLWCLAAAYLIVVKRVQNRIFYSMKNFLFGSNDATPAPVFADNGNGNGFLSQNDLQALAQMLRANFEFGSNESSAPAAAQTNNSQEDKTDEFILSQINRHAR